MRIFNTLRSRMIAAGIVTGIAAASAVAVHAGWGPDRPTFTWAHPATYVTFNSMTDNPKYGDERPFYDVRDANSNTNQDKINVHDNQELVFRVYYHNNAASNLNKVAKNTHVSMLLPKTPSTNTWSTAYISADNASPKVVGDTVELTGDLPFTLEYEKGTAQLWNNVFRGKALSDDITTSSGALIGYDKIDGKVPGCEQYSGYITIKVKVHMPQPNPTVSCDALDVTQVNRTRFNFVVRATAKNATISGYNFTAKNDKDAVVDSSNVATNDTTANYTFDQSKAGLYTVTAIVKTDRGNATSAACTKQINVGDVEVYECTSFNVDLLADRKVTARVSYKAEGGAKLKTITYDFGDNTSPLVSDKTSVDHTYAKDGDYKLTATLAFKLKDGSKAKINCTQSITVKTPITPPVTTIPNTGAGSVVGLFAGTSALAAGAHYVLSARRAGRE